MYSQEINQSSSKIIPSIKNDSLKPIVKDSILPVVSDSLTLKSKDSIAKPKEILEAIIEHTADSLIKQDIKNNKIILYHNAHVHYKQTDLKAGYIEIDNNTNVVIAKGIKDSIGDYTQLPVFTEGPDSTTQDSIRFNFKTEKAKIWGLVTEQEGIKIKGSVTKKENDSTVYVRDIIFTTSEKDKPDYYIKTKKAKIVPDKKIVIGFSNLVIQEVPTPLFLPFAYIPLTKGSTSGFLMPTWGQNNQQGFFLQNGGYYFALSDYVDLAVLADIYTNGSWGVRTESNYALRYKFSGNFNFRFESLINGQRGFDDYSKTNNYNIRWSHSQDSKSSPNARFSASVNLGSSKYYRQSLNEFDNNSYLNNTLSSSVNYYKKLVGTPFNFSASITHSQNTNTEVINMSLPSFLLNMDRIYPFASKSGSKKNALQRTGLTYALKSDVRVSTTDEFFFKQKMFEDMKTGMQQNASLSTNLKLLKYFTVSPSLNYKEVWYFDKLQKTYDEDEDKIVVDTINGFNAFREFSTGASLGTKVYGMLNFKKGKIKAIRHVMTPSISYNYRPDMSNYYEEVQQSADPTDLIEYSPFANGIYGSPGRGVSNGLSMSLNNTLEAKAKSKDSLESDDPSKDRIITILNNLNFSTSYNIALDSLRWSPISMNAGTFLFDKKMQVNLSASMDPYALNLEGQRINESNISQGGSLLRLTNASFTANYSFSSKKDTQKPNKQEQNKIDNNSDGIFGEDFPVSNDLSEPNREDQTEKLYSAKFPWTLKLAYAINYLNSNRQNEISSNSLMFSGDIELTPKWNVGISSGYDIKGNGFTYTQLRFGRDLDSWRMSFNWVPFGERQTYYFFIGIKSSMLSDLKYDQRQPRIF
ncbi:putative LPS assembly protein LptD [Lutibacter sp. HS1-25]|uniref:putative LPS assembly protein LptD n=1 Tax=Lutibacter sp. HS1-25 TaxID=2485000 RepID=UPI001F0C1EE7|nr:putative LPS assembly protein LptD [Lutibacter sp. HS1-25]